MNILIIEDDEGTRLVLRTLLEAAGHEVAEAATAEEAIERERRSPAEMIFLDLFLPGMDGFELCRWLRRQPGGDRQYILAGTSSTRPEDLGRVLEAGADDYIAKPYEPKLLEIRLQVADQHLKNLAARKQLEHDLRQERERLAYLAEHDPLTGLGNRAALSAALAELAAPARAWPGSAVIYIDLDNFKVVNDTAGHAAGDRLLKQVAYTLKSAIRAGDRAFRFGGDEFVLLLADVPLPEAVNIAERVRAALDHFGFADGERTFVVSGSLGVAPVQGGTTPESVLAAADAASYRAKARGRNRVAIHQPGDETIAHLREETDWAARVRDALREGRFELRFQPIIHVASGRVEFHEVLLRMLGENDAVIPPGTFLPPAERYRLMPEIDRHVLTHAAVALHDDPSLVVSLNLSGQSMTEEGFSGFLISTFAAATVDPARVILEITETAVISNLTAAQAFIQRVHEAGFRFALDDFGAGFSSFKYLSSLAVDFLKIDGSFVKQAGSDPVNWTFVEVMNQLAHSLGLKSVAEWVEDAATLDRLRTLGVDYAQGYYIGMPEPRKSRDT